MKRPIAIDALLKKGRNFNIYLAVALISLAAACSSGTTNSSATGNTPNPNGRHDDWGMTGYGGGGAMFYPAVSPFNPDYAFVACDMTGSYVTYNGGASWRMFNLRNPVNYFVFDPIDSNVVYANGVGLFKSADRGVSWTLFYPDPSEVGGIVSQGDHAHEALVTRDSTQRRVQAFAIDPDNNQKLYAAISIDNNAAAYVSENGGKSWTKEKDLAEGAMNIYIDPSSPKENRAVYFAAKNSITIKSNGNWQANKVPDGVNLIIKYGGGFDKGKNKFIIYGISGKSYFDPEGKQSGIFYTENGGADWENRQDGLLAFNREGAELPEFRTIATSEKNPGVVYVSYNDLSGNGDTTYIGVAKSVDYGNTWELVWKDILAKGGNKPAANFTSGWLNIRFGPTWGENPFSIGVSATNPDVCYATDFGRTVKTVDGGKTWTQEYTNKKDGGGWVTRGLEVTTGYNIVFDPFDSTHVFICNTDIGLMESTDAGQSWTSATLNNGVPRRWQNSTYWLEFDPEVRGKVWAVMSGTHDLPRPKMWRRTGITRFTGGILSSEDGGKTWTPLSEHLGEGAFTHILMDPSSPDAARTLYASAFGKGVYKSTDGGKTWTQKNKGIDGKEPFAWRITRRDSDGALFLVVYRRSDDGSIGNALDGALYRSDDGAETWKKLDMPAETNAPMSLVIDPKDPKHILLGAWGRSVKGKFAPDIGGGIYLSKDEGQSWTPVLQHDQHIHDITYDPRNNTYYACGFNGSAYRSEDLGASWKRIKGYNFKWGKRVEPDPSDPEKVYIITFGGGVWHGPARGDEKAAEDITTPLAHH
ncbi:MAG TPA: hypothetical protein PK339_06300 [Flavitalea sp.]|nr:hypothetical protein [Flavitalea sp.]